MKPVAIILVCALVGVMGWLVLESRSEARGARNQLELLRRQQDVHPSTPTDAQMASVEGELVAQQMNRQATAPTLPPVSAPPAPGALPPSAAPAPIPGALSVPSLPAPGAVAPTPQPQTMVGSTPAVTAALEAAAAAPLPMTPRQRQILAAPALAEVKHYAKEYGFVEITAGTARKIEQGMGFAIRRGNAIIARVKVTAVEEASAVADVDSRTLPPGVLIEIGDEVIQDLPPES